MNKQHRQANKTLHKEGSVAERLKALTRNQDWSGGVRASPSAKASRELSLFITGTRGGKLMKPGREKFKACANERNMLAQHVAFVCTPCCAMLHDVGICCVRFETSRTSFPTYANISFVLVTMKHVATCCVRLHDSHNIVRLGCAHCE